MSGVRVDDGGLSGAGDGGLRLRGEASESGSRSGTPDSLPDLHPPLVTGVPIGSSRTDVSSTLNTTLHSEGQWSGLCSSVASDGTPRTPTAQQTPPHGGPSCSAAAGVGSTEQQAGGIPTDRWWSDGFWVVWAETYGKRGIYLSTLYGRVKEGRQVPPTRADVEEVDSVEDIQSAVRLYTSHVSRSRQTTLFP